GVHDASCKLIRAGGGSNDSPGRIVGVSRILFVHTLRHRRVGVHDVTGLFVHFLNGSKGLFLRGVAAAEVFHLLPHLPGDLITSALGKLPHVSAVFLCVPSGSLVDQSLQVAGDQDIHGRGGCENELPVPVVTSRGEEIKKNFILIGGADQLRNRHTHLFGIVRSQNI